jgi:hypothetical protein
MKSSISRRLPGSSLGGSEPRRGCRIKMRWPYAHSNAANTWSSSGRRWEAASAMPGSMAHCGPQTSSQSCRTPPTTRSPSSRCCRRSSIASSEPHRRQSVAGRPAKQSRLLRVDGSTGQDLAGHGSEDQAVSNQGCAIALPAHTCTFALLADDVLRVAVPPVRIF